MKLRTPSLHPRADIALATVVSVAWLSIMVTAASIWIKPWPDILFRADFVAFWSAGAMVREGSGESLFDLHAQRAFQQELRLSVGTTAEARLAVDHSPFYNLPALALLFVPLSLLPLEWAYLAWNAASAAMIVASVAFLLRGRPWAATITASLFATGFAAATLFEGQVNGMFALALSLGILSLRRGKRVTAGACLGMLWLKPQYAGLLLIVLVAKRRWQEIAGMMLSGLLIGGLSLWIVGPDGARDFVVLLGQVGHFYSPEGFRVSPEAMINWRGVLMALPGGIPEETGYVLMIGLGVVTVASTLLVWREGWAPSSSRFAAQMMATVTATLIASPHSHFHGMVILLPVVALALESENGTIVAGRAWIEMLSVGYVLTLVAFPFRGISWLLVPYLLVAAGMLLKSAPDKSRRPGAAEALA